MSSVAWSQCSIASPYRKYMPEVIDSNPEMFLDSIAKSVVISRADSGWGSGSPAPDRPP
jgi:hypothetical protein